MSSAVDVCRDLVAIDSNNLEDTYFSLYLRVKNFDMASVEKALYRSGSIARVKGLKNYMQVITREILAPIYAITLSGRESAVDSALKSWGITDGEYSKLEQAIINALSGKEKTLSQLKNSLASISRGVERGKGRRKERAMDVSIVAGTMADRWILLRGGIGRSPGESPNRFSLFRDRFKSLELNMNKDAALELLAKRYVASYGPVCVDDLTWWLGVQQRDASAVLKKIEGLERVEISGVPGEFYVLKDALASIGSVKKDTSVLLLSKDDPYVKAYRNTGRFVPEGHSVITKFGESASIVLLNGVVSGTWSIERERLSEVCVVRLFDERPEIEGLEERLKKATAETGRFYAGREIEVSVKGL